MAIIKLNQTNRIVDHPNRYKLNQVTGETNVYDFERYNGLVTEEGTPFNKIYGDTIDDNFDYIYNNLNGILKYNIPSYIHEKIGEGEIVSINSFTNEDTTNHTIQCNNIYTLYGGLNSTHAIRLYNSTTLNCPPSSTQRDFGFRIDEGKVITSITASGNGGTGSIYGSNDGGVTDTYIGDILNSVSQTFDLSGLGYNYIRVHTNARTASGTGYVFISKLYIDASEYINKYTIDTLIDYDINNKRLLVNTPNNVSLTSTIQNTLNEVEIDTILQANKYYELVYNEAQDKFICEEVRNAN